MNKKHNLTKDEIEVKILDVDVVNMHDRLIKAGAHCIFRDVLTKTLIFDHPNLRLRNSGKVLRLREVGSRAYLSIKEGMKLKNNSPFQKVQESEIMIDNFMNAFQLFEGLGFEAFRYQEKKRTAYRAAKGIKIEIDQYPGIPPYLEIEGSKEYFVEEFVKKIGYEMKDTTHISATQVLKNYGVKDVDIIRFDKKASGGKS